MNANRLFNHLLERYAFRVADEIIQLADSQSQATLIGLINQIDSEKTNQVLDLPVEEDSRPATHSPVLDKQLFRTPANHLEEQYRSVLKNSLPQETILKNNEHIYRLINLNLTQIGHTIRCIKQLKELVNRSEKNLSSQPQKLILINHLRVFINKQESYVAELSDRNQKNYRRLEQ